MEFWGVEVKAGESLKVQPEFSKLIHISQAALGEVKDIKGAKDVPIRMKLDEDEYVIGTLSAEARPQMMLDLVSERKFEVSHDWKNEQNFPDESDDEDYPIEALENGGKPQPKVEETKKEEAPESHGNEDDDSDDSGSDDLSGEMDSDEFINVSDDSSDEETPKEQQPKKRPYSPVSNKKAKLANPGNASVHIATPYPYGKAGKTPTGNKTK